MRAWKRVGRETLPWGSNDQTENPKEQWDESYCRDNLETTPIYKKDKSFTNVGTLLLVWQDNVFEMLTSIFFSISLFTFLPFSSCPPLSREVSLDLFFGEKGGTETQQGESQRAFKFHSRFWCFRKTRHWVKQREFGVQVFREKSWRKEQGSLPLLNLEDFPKLEIESLRGGNEIIEAGNAEEGPLWANPKEALKSPGRLELRHRRAGKRLPTLREEPWEVARFREGRDAWCF